MKSTWILSSLIVLLPLFAQAQEPPAPASADPAQVAPDATIAAEPSTDQEATLDVVDGVEQLRKLANHRWTLISANDAQSQPASALFPANGRLYQFAFSDTGVSIQGVCNSFAGAYQLNAEGLLEIPPLRATMMACAPELMAADTALTALLAQPLRMEFLEGAVAQLQLQTPANDTLLLEGQITPEALYGPGTIMFLEVDAQRLACRNPRNSQTTCLQVRELVFDEQGLRVPPPGPWKPFYDTIDGYTHTPGERNVLRVKRFERPKASNTTASYLYVLDLIVETEKVPD